MKAHLVPLAALALSACTSPHPRSMPPDIVEQFSGDYQKMAECLNDEIEKINVEAPRLTWRPTQKSADVLVVPSIMLVPRIVQSYVVRETEPDRFEVEYRTIHGLVDHGDKNDSGWKRVETCAAAIG